MFLLPLPVSYPQASQMVTWGRALIKVSVYTFLFFPEEVGRRADRKEWGEKRTQKIKRKQDVKIEMGYYFFPIPPSRGGEAVVCRKLPLPVLPRMSHSINHAPKLKMTANLSIPSKPGLGPKDSSPYPPPPDTTTCTFPLWFFSLQQAKAVIKEFHFLRFTNQDNRELKYQVGRP